MVVQYVQSTILVRTNEPLKQASNSPNIIIHFIFSPASYCLVSINPLVITQQRHKRVGVTQWIESCWSCWKSSWRGFSALPRLRLRKTRGVKKWGREAPETLKHVVSLSKRSLFHQVMLTSYVSYGQSLSLDAPTWQPPQKHLLRATPVPSDHRCPWDQQRRWRRACPESKGKMSQAMFFFLQ